MIRRFARPYARALSEVITSPKEAKSVFEELSRFEEVRRGSPELAQLFDHPGVSSEQKNSVIQAVGEKLGLSDLGIRVLEVLAANHRINRLAAVLEAWREIINRSQGVEVAEVRVAHELSKGERERLRAALETKLGKRIDLNLDVDPSILGGFVAKVGSEVYDGSVTGRIEKFRQSLHAFAR